MVVLRQQLIFRLVLSLILILWMLLLHVLVIAVEHHILLLRLQYCRLNRSQSYIVHCAVVKAQRRESADPVAATCRRPGPTVHRKSSSCLPCNMSVKPEWMFPAPACLLIDVSILSGFLQWSWKSCFKQVCHSSAWELSSHNSLFFLTTCRSYSIVYYFRIIKAKKCICFRLIKKNMWINIDFIYIFFSCS